MCVCMHARTSTHTHTQRIPVTTVWKGIFFPDNGYKRFLGCGVDGVAGQKFSLLPLPVAGRVLYEKGTVTYPGNQGTRCNLDPTTSFMHFDLLEP